MKEKNQKSKVKSTLEAIVAIGMVMIVASLITWAIAGMMEVNSDSKCAVNIEVEFLGNLILDKYDVELMLDGKSIGILRQGTITKYEFTLSKGSHTVTFCQVPSVNGSAEFNVEDDMKITYSIKCHTAVIDVEQL